MNEWLNEWQLLCEASQIHGLQYSVKIAVMLYYKLESVQ